MGSPASESAWTAEDINIVQRQGNSIRVHLEACFEQKNMKKQYFNATSTNPIHYVVRQTKTKRKQGKGKEYKVSYRRCLGGVRTGFAAV